MKILGIETSCDETGICVLDASGEMPNITFKVLGDALYSQIAIHAQYGGVFPMMAKRAHTKNILELTKLALTQANDWQEESSTEISLDKENAIRDILKMEDDLASEFIKTISKIGRPNIDAIAVTHGPGLEPALWVGVNFARALSIAWDIPIIPSNHMQGHIFSVLLTPDGNTVNVQFPAIALLISGGHTELILVNNWLEFIKVGQTRDDAVGEAFDKVARILGLPYPGGPEISKLADIRRKEKLLNPTEPIFKLPRPMINSNDLDFSFSGLKTAVLYTVKGMPTNSTPTESLKPIELTDEVKKDLASEFEDAVTEVLISKTFKAVEKHDAQSIIIGGGVSCNKNIRANFEKAALERNIPLLLPNPKMSTDNAVMIALAGYINIINKVPTQDGYVDIKPQGNLAL